MDTFILKCKEILVDCKECGKTMHSKNMKRHIRNTHEPKETKDMSLTSVLKSEKSDVLPSDKKQRYKDCEECGKSLNARSMRRHIRSVHNEMVTKKEETEKLPVDTQSNTCQNLPDQPSRFSSDEIKNSLWKF